MEVVVKDHGSDRVFRPSQAAAKPLRGRVILVHGLNLAPVSMDPMARFLADNGFVVLRLALSGHRESFSELMRLGPETWLTDMERAVATFNAMELEVREVPLHGVGFSLGGVLLSHHARMHQGVTAWSSLSLLAPAFVPRLGAGLPLGIIPRWLPYISFAPRRFRRWGVCPHNAYRSVGELMRAHASLLRQRPMHDSMTGPRCLVMIHPRDELIHAQRLADSFFATGLSQYEVRYLKDIHRSWTIPRHLICHPDVLTVTAWDGICRGIMDNLTPPASEK